MYAPNSLVYTGTHDNETMKGWIDHASPTEINMIRDYLGGNVRKEDMVKELIRVSLMSVAVFAIFPLQDIYEIGSDGRMNTPSTLGKNWAWRMSANHFNPEKAVWLRKYSKMYARNL